jgi:hypothetical protein
MPMSTVGAGLPVSARSAIASTSARIVRARRFGDAIARAASSSGSARGSPCG